MSNNIYVNISKDLHERFESFFKSKDLELKIFDSNLVSINCDLKEFYAVLDSFPLIKRYVERIFVINSITKDLNEVFDTISNKTIRVIAYPNNFQEDFLNSCFEKKIKLSPTQFDFILYIIKDKDSYSYGLFESKLFYKKPIEENHTCRAYYKIKEIMLRTNIDFNNKIVFDLGAAPGGWCEYLKPIAKKVFAVDPAEVVVSGANIIHYKAKLEDVIGELNKNNPDIIICDINRDPEELLSHIFKLNIQNTKLVLTLKFSKDNKKYIQKRIEELNNLLETKVKFKSFFWLFANTNNERTLFCEMI